MKERLNQMVIKSHTVAKGETLWGIANKYGSTVEAIRTANPDKIRPDNIIYVGQVLVVPISEGSDAFRAAFEKALKDIRNLDSVKKLVSMMGE